MSLKRDMRRRTAEKSAMRSARRPCLEKMVTALMELRDPPGQAQTCERCLELNCDREC